MSGSAQLKLCILWESEIRAAVKFMKAAEALPDDAEGRGEAFNTAWTMVRTALWHVDDNAALCLVGSDEIKKSLDETAEPKP